MKDLSSPSSKIYLLVSFVLCFSFFLPVDLFAQCNDPSCLTDQLIINTGYDFGGGTVLPTSSPTTAVQDPHWILINAPTGNGPVNLGSPAFVIPTYPAWNDMPPVSSPPSRYISAFPRAGANEANISGTPYIFQRKICVCDTTTVTFQENVHVDNRAELKLYGPTLPGTGVLLSSYPTTNLNNFLNPPEDDGPVVLTLDPGTYFLQAEMRNDNAGSPMGLNIECTLTADKVALADQTCCNNGAFVSGFKFLDANCNGIQEATENLDDGWLITLRNALGVPVATTTTDVSGYYFFNITTPGTYTIEEAVVAPWTQSFPVSPTVHSVTITGTEVISNLNFGNCCPDCLAFQNNAANVAFNCVSDGLDVSIKAVTGLQAGDTWSVDINGDNNYEISGIPFGQTVTYTFPHDGTFNLRLKATRIACGEPCEVFLTKSIFLKPEVCVDSECYEWTELEDQLFIFDMCEFDNQVIAGGADDNLPLLASWDGSSWQNIPGLPNGAAVFEVEPFMGNLYALSLNILTNRQVLYCQAGTIWFPILDFPVNSNFSSSGPSFAFTFLSEIERTSSGLFAAFYKNSSTFTSHEIRFYDGSTWTLLPDPPAQGGGGSSVNYYQIGQYSDEPLVRVDILNGAFAGFSYLATWTGTAWNPITPTFTMATQNPTTFNASGITVAKQVGNDLIVGGSFTGLGFGAPAPNTTGIARLNLAGPVFQSVGGGETSNAGTSFNPIFITGIEVIGQNIFVGGYNIQKMGGVSVLNSAWFDGSSWKAFNNSFGLYNSTVAVTGDGDYCEVFMGGEPYFGKAQLCCIYDDLTLSQTENGRKLYHTNGSITSTSTINPNADITYKAGNGIFLNPPFNVVAGASFAAIPEGCEDCCPPDPLTALPWLAPFVGDNNYSIEQCMYNGDCIYVIRDYCLVSDGTTTYYDCYGNIICETFPFGGNCPSGFNPTNCVMLQACSISFRAEEQETEPSASLQVFPNPLRGQSRVQIILPRDTDVQLQLLDMNGRLMQTLEQGTLSKGRHAYKLDSADLGPGMYFLLLRTGNERLVQRVVVIR